MLKQAFNDLAVGTVIEGKAAVSVDGEVVHLVSEGRGSAVFDVFAEPCGDGLYKLLALAAGDVVLDRHGNVPPSIWYVHISL